MNKAPKPWAAPNRLSNAFTETRDGSTGAFGSQEQALAFAVSVMSPWVTDRDIFIPFLDEQAMTTLKHFTRVTQRVGHDGKEKTVGYRVDDLSFEQWLECFSSSGLAAKWLRIYLAKNIETGYPMPPGAREFAASLANGLENPTAPQLKG